MITQFVKIIWNSFQHSSNIIISVYFVSVYDHIQKFSIDCSIMCSVLGAISLDKHTSVLSRQLWLFDNTSIIERIMTTLIISSKPTKRFVHIISLCSRPIYNIIMVSVLFQYIYNHFCLSAESSRICWHKHICRWRLHSCSNLINLHHLCVWCDTEFYCITYCLWYSETILLYHTVAIWIWVIW